MAKVLNKIDFVIMQNTKEFANPFVLQVKMPYCIGQTIKVAQDDEEEKEALMRAIANGDPVVKVKGYSIFFVPAGTFTGVRATPEEMKEALRGMADFYAEDYLQRHKHPNRRYEEGCIPGTDEANGAYFKALKEQRKAKESE